ncbi:penicillin-binding protein [Polaribacter pacificus]|uniref:Penicillin-binding protein n=2 Tax=Polaribacter pacificus TaxID=1775173 RepID=A0A917MC95_9FLAO|nr:penicillin-binding protein [Polaribacter pacificus]
MLKGTPAASLNDVVIKEEKKDSVVEEKVFRIERFSRSETAKLKHKLDSLLKRINKRNDFHGSILVAKNGKLAYQNQIGFADFQKKKPLTENSAFQLASVSKQFTAAAIMILKERNQLQLNDTVTKYFPNFPFKQITIKNLLNHTAGLPKYFWVAEHEWEKEKAPTNLEMMQLLETSLATKYFSPGRRFDYSNTGYFVLASIIEKVTDLPFANFIKSSIFDPLQMSKSFVYSFENDSIRSNQLTGYRLYKGWRHLKINGTVNDAVVGDKNIYATTEDLLKWILALNQGAIISKESLDLMYTKGETKYGKKIPYGFGFRIDEKNDQKIIYHYGKWNGFSTGITQYPEDDLVVIILEHTSYSAISYLDKKIKDLVLENLNSNQIKP